MAERIQLVKAFATNPDQGNPAGVLLNADHLSADEMTAIAAQLGFSESAFVQDSNIADFKLRFFSPTQEVGLCAHATIAAFHTLNHVGRLMFDGEISHTSQETQLGVFEIEVHQDGLVTMQQAPVEYLAIENDRHKISKLLNINANDFLDYPLELVSTGTPKMMIPVKNLDCIKMIRPNLDAISDYCEKSQCRGLYPFTPETLDTNHDFFARQFNPLAGINEDPITGIAAGALGCYAKKYGLISKAQIVVEQGYFMNKGGLIFVSISDPVRVGGYAVNFGERLISI